MTDFLPQSPQCSSPRSAAQSQSLREHAVSSRPGRPACHAWLSFKALLRGCPLQEDQSSGDSPRSESSHSASQPGNSAPQPIRTNRSRRARRGCKSPAALLALALLAAACRGDDPRSAGTDPADGEPGSPSAEPADPTDTVVTPSGDEIRLASALSGFGDCDELLGHLRAEGAERVGPWGFGDGYRLYFAETEESIAASDTEGGDDSDGDVADIAQTTTVEEGVDFSGTNLAELDVDEADLVKTDGQRVFVLAADKLTVIDAESREVTGTLALDAEDRHRYGAEMFLHGDDLLVISPLWAHDYPEPLGDPERSLPADLLWGGPLTEILRVRVTDGVPAVLEGIVVGGEYVNSRSVDGVARIITRSSPAPNLGFVYPASDAGADAAERHNRQAVLDSELSDWLPGYVRLDSDGYSNSTELLLGCESVHAPETFAGFGVLSVLSVDVDGSIDTGRTTGVLAPGSVVYASTESVFVATQTWIDDIVFEGDEDALQDAWEKRQTSIHRFDLSGDQASYAASGSVPGDLRDHFSMSEHDGHLRVVTTSGDPWDESSETFVRVLREDDGVLRQVGSVGEIGKGEAVQSVRMIGDVGYVVTFRQIDPFYTLDLSTPDDPRVVGELKIPGFSSYLHPIGDGLVLGVGTDADDEGRVRGAKVSVFDVSDPADPAEVAVWNAPDGWSDAGWEHRSFLWWAPEKLAVIPLQVQAEIESLDDAVGEAGHWAGAVVLRVDGSEISEVGRFDHDTSDEAPRGSTDCNPMSPEQMDSSLTEASELWWMVSDEGVMVVTCDPDDEPAVAGYDCYEEQWARQEAEAAGLSIRDDERLLVCWQGYQMPAIGRTMVIDRDELWSVSGRWGVSSSDPARVQVNDLAGLNRLAAVDIG